MMQAIQNMLSIAAQSAVRVVFASPAVHRGCIHSSYDATLTSYMIDVSAKHSAKDHAARGVKLNL